MTKKPEDLTLEEIREQLSLYQRLFYQKMKESPEYMERRREIKRKHRLKKKTEEEERKLQEGITTEPRRGKYNKDLNDALIIV